MSIVRNELVAVLIFFDESASIQAARQRLCFLGLESLL